MKKLTGNRRWKKRISGLLAMAMTGLMVSCPVLDDKGLYAYAQEIQVQAGTVVTTCDEFLSAIAQKKPVILVQGSVTVVNGALSSGKMKPVVIPEGTTIMSVTDAENSGDKGTLSFRCPVQIGGENVVFKNIELFFISGDALGSVPHREIFLAGHALTLDNVTTQPDRNGGSLGDLGGSEEQLPVVYAGGFEGTQNGDRAALYIQNSNSKTVIQKIYMAHDAGTETMTGYNGAAYDQLVAGRNCCDG